MNRILRLGMAAAAVFLAGHPLCLGSQEAQPVAFNEADEIAKITRLNDTLDEEGCRLLNEFVQVLPKLDVKKLKAETNDKFPLSMLESLKAEFDAKHAPFKIGETVTVVTRVKVYKGPFGGMKDGRLVVGNKLVPTIDLTQDTIDRANPVVSADKRRDFLQRAYYAPKAAYMLKAKEMVFADRLAKLEGFYSALEQGHGKGRAALADNKVDVNVAVYVPAPVAAPSSEAAPEQPQLPGQNTPTLASDSKENLN